MRRRRFLGTVAAALGAGALPRPAGAALPPEVAVVGGGPAGISAALELAERGVRVTLIEAATQLGGKVIGWTGRLGGEVVDMEHGVHGLAEGYVHFTDLLTRYGLEGALVRARVDEAGIRAPGRREWSVQPGRSPGLTRELRRRARAAGYRGLLGPYLRGTRQLRGLSREAARARYGGRSVADLYAGGEAPLTRYRLLAGTVARSLYFVEPEQLDAGTFAISERWNGLRVRWMRGNPQELIWEPLGDALRAHGVRILLGEPVSALLTEGERVVGVRVGAAPSATPLPALGPEWAAGSGPGWPVFSRLGPRGPEALLGRCTHAGCPVALAPDGGFACPCHGGRFDGAGRPVAGPPEEPLERLVVIDEGEGPAAMAPDTRELLRADAVILAVDAPAFARLAGPLIPRARGLRGCRHTVARFWLDRDVDRRSRYALLLDGFPHASNAFLLHRFQDRSRSWAARTGGAVIELQAFRDLPALRGEDLLDRLEDELWTIWPELRGAAVLRRSLTDSETFTRFDPSWQEAAGGVRTGVPGLLAAGDHVAVDRDCQFMELAVYSGRLAANAVLSEAGLPTAPILPERRGPRHIF